MRNNITVTFESLQEGAIFEYDNSVFMKISSNTLKQEIANGFNCMRLSHLQLAILKENPIWFTIKPETQVTHYPEAMLILEPKQEPKKEE
jgi:hypothetical protein